MADFTIWPGSIDVSQYGKQTHLWASPFGNRDEIIKINDTEVFYTFLKPKEIVIDGAKSVDTASILERGKGKIYQILFSGQMVDTEKHNSMTLCPGVRYLNSGISMGIICSGISFTKPRVGYKDPFTWTSPNSSFKVIPEMDQRCGRLF
jgi:hypothetical protein